MNPPAPEGGDSSLIGPLPAPDESGAAGNVEGEVPSDGQTVAAESEASGAGQQVDNQNADDPNTTKEPPPGDQGDGGGGGG